VFTTERSREDSGAPRRGRVLRDVLSVNRTGTRPNQRLGQVPLSPLCKTNQINKLISARRPVSRVLSRALPPLDGHSSGTPVAGRLARPTRESGAEGTWAGCPAPFSYLVLLPVGFTVPAPLPEPRCALTAPFHPYRGPEGPWRSDLCGTVPKIALAGRYPAPSFRGARTFLHRIIGSGHPAIWHGL
jgi:hypothetical protein